MKNIYQFFSLKNFKDSIQILWTRFPIASILIIINTGFIWYQVNNTTDDSVLIVQTILTLIVTTFLSASIALFVESKKPTSYTRWLPILPLLYGISFFFSIHSLDLNSGVFDENLVYFSLHLVGFITFIFFAPFVSNHTWNEKVDIQYTNYFTRVTWALLMSSIVGGALMALWSIAIAAIGTLFDLNEIINTWKLYENWLVFALAFIAPLYGLMYLPRRQEIGQTEYDTNKFFAFIIRFVVITFVFLYFCILYAYSIKVLLNITDWPKGEISWLVIGFSIFGYLAYIFAKSYEEDYKVVQIFRRYFPIAVLPQIGMLGYAIFLRINQYDLTMNRYFVVIFGVWLTIISLYFVVGKIKSLTIIPATLFIITLLASVGPWWVYQLPLERQYTLLIKNLKIADILNEDKISKASNSLDPILENTIYSGIQYICQFEDCIRVKTLFASVLVEAQKRDENDWNNNPYNVWKPYTGLKSWNIVTTVSEALWITWRDTSGMNNTRKYLNYTTKDNDMYMIPLKVTGYDTLYPIRSYYPGDTSTLSGSDTVIVNIDKEVLTLREQNKDILFSLQDINTKLLQKYNNSDNSTLPPEDLTFILTNDNRSIKIILQSYALPNPKFTGTDTPEYASVSGWALVKQ